MNEGPLRIGVLALQGDFEAHRRMLDSLEAQASEVRTPEQLVGLDGLVIPGGESTTTTMGMEREGLHEAIPGFHRAGGPILGSCAGMIVCDRGHLGLADYVCRRNAFGRQLQSFEEDLRVEGLGEEPLRAVFIRAPWIEERGPGVEILAEVEGHPVAVRDGNVLAVAFHAELTDDSRLHASFMAMCTAARRPRVMQGRSARSDPFSGGGGAA
ncbi:MAG: pyridoxal 5'-phosphate synthase glutaminase subunit PdxT [Solirubrobacterales bacterium]